MKRHLCIDIDNVIAQTDDVMRRVIRDFTGGRVNLKYENIKSFNYYECSDDRGERISKAEWTQIHDEFSRAENIMSVQPVHRVQEHLASLRNRRKGATHTLIREARGKVWMAPFVHSLPHSLTVRSSLN